MTFGAQDESSKKAAENIVVKVPFLYFGGTRDMVCRPELMKGSEDAGLLPHSKTVTVDAGHWCIYKRPKETGEAILGWLNETF
jgi:soluble epoxide hydrolase / lipid-phosphate phosphatase